MRWKSGRRSSNIEDRRGQRVPVGGKLKGGGIGVLLIILASLYFGIDPSVILNSPMMQESSSQQSPVTRPPSAAEESLADFVSVVLADTEDTWTELFSGAGRDYRQPTLVLFSEAVQSACGMAGAAVGPFYCPADHKVYLDLGFFRQLKEQLGAPGDFARAYVIAHEVGHHVQTLTGISQQVQAKRSQLSEKAYNQLQVKLELQADCFAGIWAHHADRMRNILEPGDMEEALNAASMIGDDTLQRKSRGYVVPDSFTHGSSEQRVRWFERGFQQGSVGACNTFGS